MAAHALGTSQAGAVLPTSSSLVVDLSEVRIARDGFPYTLLQSIHYYITVPMRGTQNGKNVMDHRTLQSAGSFNRIQATIQ